MLKQKHAEEGGHFSHYVSVAVNRHWNFNGDREHEQEGLWGNIHYMLR